MELAILAELYAPSVDKRGNYIDNVPTKAQLSQGIRCPCGARKDKVYDSVSIFNAHIKTKTHQKWLESLNLNRSNFYVENESLKTTISSQRLIIAQLEKEVQTKLTTIDVLSQQIRRETNNVTNNLLEYD